MSGWYPKQQDQVGYDSNVKFQQVIWNGHIAGTLQYQIEVSLRNVYNNGEAPYGWVA